MNELILFTSEDGQTQMHLRVEGGTIWLTQLEVAELFQTTKNNVSIHTRNIFAEEELTPEATVKESLTVQNEGNRQVKRTIAKSGSAAPRFEYPIVGAMSTQFIATTAEDKPYE